MFRKETPFWIWLCKETTSNSSMISQPGELFTAIIDRLRTDNFNMNAAMTSFQCLSSQMQQYSFDADKIVRDTMSQEYFDVGHVQKLSDIVELKCISQNIKAYVELFMEGTVEHFDMFRKLSRDIFSDINQACSLLCNLKIEKSQLEACVENLRNSLFYLIESLKENIIKHHYEFFRGNNPVGYRAINLGYIVHCVEFMEKLINRELGSQPLSYTGSDYLDFPDRMYSNILDWYDDLQMRLDYLTEPEEENYSNCYETEDDLDEPITF